MNKIVLGYPYDGALFWLLDPNPYRTNKNQPYLGKHPYYQRLYGPQHFKIAPKAASLCILYDEIIMAPADAGLPEYRAYQTNEGYFNPHLGLRTSWSDFRKAQEWLEEQVRKDLEIPAVAATLPKNPFARKFILERTNFQILLALKYGAKILAGPRFFKTLGAKFAHSQNVEDFKTKRTESQAKPKLLSNYFNISCFEFSKLNYDRILALRSDRTVKRYAQQFNQVLNQAVDSENPTHFFLSKMGKTMKRRDILSQVENGFSTGGRCVNLASLHPLVKPIAKPFGLVLKAARAGVNVATRRDSWMLLAPRMSEVILREELKRKSK